MICLHNKFLIFSFEVIIYDIFIYFLSHRSLAGYQSPQRVRSRVIKRITKTKNLTIPLHGRSPTSNPFGWVFEGLWTPQPSHVPTNSEQGRGLQCSQCCDERRTGAWLSLFTRLGYETANALWSFVAFRAAPPSSGLQALFCIAGGSLSYFCWFFSIHFEEVLLAAWS